MAASIRDIVERLRAALQPRDDAFQRREITAALRASSSCPLCALTERSVSRYLDILAYEHVNDIPMRDHLRASRGFCNQHAWQMLEQIRDPMGIGIIYRDVVNDVVKTLERYSRRSGPARARSAGEPDHALTLARNLRPRRPCVACDQTRMVNEDNLHALSRYMLEPEFARAYEASVGVCAWHARALLPRIRQADAVRIVLGTLRRWVGELDATECRDDAQTKLQAAIGGSSGARPFGGVIWSEVRAIGAHGFGDVNSVDIGPQPQPESRPLWLAHLDCPICAGSHAQADRRGATSSQADPASLCSEHMGRRVAEFGARGTPVLGLLGHLGEAAAIETVGSRGQRRGVSDWISGREQTEVACPDCRAEAEASLSLIGVSLAGDGAQSLSSACLPHLYQSCLVPDPARARPAMIAVRAESWRSLVDQLLEYIRKLDYRFRSEPRGDEQLAPRLAVPQMVGHRRLG